MDGASSAERLACVDSTSQVAHIIVHLRVGAAGAQVPALALILLVHRIERVRARLLQIRDPDVVVREILPRSYNT
jgi:hypothetical protein